MEEWDVYDRRGIATGKTKKRNDVFLEDEYHLGASLWILDSQGRMLIQKRAPSKRIHPNKWGHPGGAVQAGEKSEQGCVREVEEEIGLKLDVRDITLFSRVFQNDSIYDDYFVIFDFPIENAVLPENEVSEIKWATIEEVRELYIAGQFMTDDIAGLDHALARIQAEAFRRRCS